MAANCSLSDWNAGHLFYFLDLQNCGIILDTKNVRLINWYERLSSLGEKVDIFMYAVHVYAQFTVWNSAEISFKTTEPN